MLYDCIIIGTGPAGISAALNFKIHAKSFMLFGSKNLSDKISKAEEILNYPGLSAVSGADFQSKLLKQLEDMKIEITDAVINSVIPMGDRFAVMAGAEFYESKTLIIATGTDMKATVIGEKEFLGKGVSYCATCDGSFYKNKIVAVICSSERFLHEVDFLAELAGKVYLFTAFEMNRDIRDNTDCMLTKVKEIRGDKRVSSVVLTDGLELEVDGVFVLRESVAVNTLLPQLETENGHIKIDRDNSTNLAGAFAAGDCTGRPYQYAKAVGEGNKAAHSCIEYLKKE